eukprot:857871-Pyramimonas_sp.AAC.1
MASSTNAIQRRRASWASDLARLAVAAWMAKEEAASARGRFHFPQKQPRALGREHVAAPLGEVRRQSEGCIR